MSHLCYFCKRERADHECEICHRAVCLQCAGSNNHNCYPREQFKISFHRGLTQGTLTINFLN